MLRNHDIQPMAASTGILHQGLSFAGRQILGLGQGESKSNNTNQNTGSIHMFHHTVRAPPNKNPRPCAAGIEDGRLILEANPKNDRSVAWLRAWSGRRNGQVDVAEAAAVQPCERARSVLALRAREVCYARVVEI